MPRLHLIHVARIQVVSTCIHLYRPSLHVSCIGDKIVRHSYMYPLVSASRTPTDTCRRLHASGANAALDTAADQSCCGRSASLLSS